MRIGGESLVFTWWVVFSLVLRTHVVVGALLKERERDPKTDLSIRFQIVSCPRLVRRCKYLPNIYHRCLSFNILLLISTG